MPNDNSVGRLFDFNVEFFKSAQNIGPVLIKQIGELKIEPRYEIATHFQHCHEISYVVSGEGVFYSGNKKFDVSRGCIHLAPYGSTHRILSSVDSPLRYIFIGFDFIDDLDESLYPLRDIFAGTEGTFIKDGRDISAAFESMISEEYDKSDFHIEMLKVNMMQILISLYRKRNLIFRRSMHLKERDGLEQRIYAVVRYIDSNISSITSVNELSKDLGYSHSYLSHVFKEKMGITLQGYINAKRIESSLQYLRNQSFSITQIAQMLEYDTVQSFGKAFKKIKNCSPSEYRSQIIQRGMAVEKKEITQEDKVYE